MAADYFSALANENKSLTDICAPLRCQCLKISDNLSKASNQAMDSDEKIGVLKEAKQLEAAAFLKVEKLAAVLRARKEP